MEEMKTGENEPVTIEFFHDVLCAWCYAFSPRIEKLAQQFPEQISIVHRAFALAPEPDGIEQIFGSKERGKLEILDHWRNANRNDDEYRINAELMATKSFDYPYSTPGLLACKAAELQGGNPMHGRMFDRVQKAHLTDCLNIGDFETLKMCAKEIGLDVEQWEKDYSSEKVKQTLNEDFQQARMYGVNTVPTIVANGKHKLSGAQTYASLEAWFKNQLL
jgi:predicted DsbA family dithiol-disulfide isomerase